MIIFPLITPIVPFTSLYLQTSIKKIKKYAPKGPPFRDGLHLPPSAASRRRDAHSARHQRQQAEGQEAVEIKEEEDGSPLAGHVRCRREAGSQSQREEAGGARVIGEGERGGGERHEEGLLFSFPLLVLYSPDSMQWLMTVYR